jgi:hypothetical protein
MEMYVKGDASIPQRFWVCVFTNNSGNAERLLNKGYCKRTVTDSELSRVKGTRTVYSLGKIADQFFQ